MKLSEIFTQLSHGELSQISIAGEEAGKLNKAGYIQLASHVNLGLTALHKRFTIKEKQYVLQLLPEVINYRLKNTYGLADILKIEKVSVDSGTELGLNDTSDQYSVFTPSSNDLRIPIDLVNGSLELPVWLRTRALKISYRANHPILTVDDGIDYPDDVEIDLPDSYLEALLYFIASRIMSPIGSGQGEMNMGNNYAIKYEQACQVIELANLKIDQDSQNNQFHRNGWV